MTYTHHPLTGLTCALALSARVVPDTVSVNSRSILCRLALSASFKVGVASERFN